MKNFVYKQIVENAHDIIFSLTIDGKVKYISPNCKEYLGFEVEEIIGKSFAVFIHPDDAATCWHILNLMKETGDKQSGIEFRIKHKKNDWCWHTVNLNLMNDDVSDEKYVIGISRDISVQKQAIDSLQENERRLKTAERIAKIGNWELNLLTDTLYWSDEIYRIFEIDSEQFGATYEAFLKTVHPEDRDVVNQTFEDSVKNKNEYAITHRLLFNDGRIKYVHERGYTTYDTNENPISSFGTVQDISERIESENKIAYQQNHDLLTGLPNRALFNERVSNILNKANGSNDEFAILFLDLDRFKKINDTLGHSVGDKMLQHISRRISDILRDVDTVARLSGDEFSILLPNTSQEEAKDVARLLLKVIKQPIFIESNELYITLSIGIAMFPDDGGETETLIKFSEMAMYKAKEKGRNDFQIFTPDLALNTINKLNLESELYKALEKEEFEVYYQPQIHLPSNEIFGVEALVRWTHPEKGTISPAEFIPLAEETGLIFSLGEWVLQTACKQVKLWHNSGYSNLQLGVNLSARQFEQKEIVDVVSKIIKETNFPASLLELEITESMAMDVDYSLEILKSLKDLGVQIAIDDFGTGYSSLNYLKRFPIDKLKIDQSFVKDLLHDEDDAAIVTAIISIAHRLGLKVIAEGVEQEKQSEFLLNNQCNKAQGYYWGKPIPAAEFEKEMLTKIKM